MMSYRFEDYIKDGLIDTQRLGLLFDAFNRALGITTAILSLEGKILIGSQWQRICTDFHRRHPQTQKMCRQSNNHIHTRIAKTAEPMVVRCPHGLMDAATPIVVEQIHVANLFAGQFLPAPPDADHRTFFKEQAARWGFDESDYLAALSEVPVIAEERITPLLQHLKHLAEMIGDLAVNRLRRRQADEATRRANRALEQENRRRVDEAKKLAQILEGTPIPTFVIDADCRVAHWNRACEVLTALPAKKMIGTRNHRDVFYDEHRDLLADLLVKKAGSHALATLYGEKVRKTQLAEAAFQGEDFFPKLGSGGKWLFFTAVPLKASDGEILGAIETLQDITDQRTAEKALRASEARYRQLFESANDAIFVLKEGILVDCNQTALTLFDASREDLIGRSPLSFSPETQANGRSSLEQLQEKEARLTGRAHQVFEWRFLDRNGSWFDTEVGLTRFHLLDVPHLLAIVRDITDRKQMIRSLQDREKELEEKSRYLERVNQALKASLDHREIEKRAVEENMLANLKRFVFPYIAELGKCALGSDAQAYLNIIETNLNDVVSRFSTTVFTKYIDFTPTEVRVADLIREGRNSKAIAELMGLSPSSIQWHRKNIREKLGLTNKKINLQTYLASLTE